VVYLVQKPNRRRLVWISVRKLNTDFPNPAFIKAWNHHSHITSKNKKSKKPEGLLKKGEKGKLSEESLSKIGMTIIEKNWIFLNHSLHKQSLKNQQNKRKLRIKTLSRIWI
jgi:hypothetical protein